MSREYPPRPIVGIGVAVLRPGAVLLARRGRPPNLGAWSLPGGAQELGETAEAAARRELAEETGLSVGPLLLAANVDSIHRDPDGRVRYHYTIIDFCARWDQASFDPDYASEPLEFFAPMVERVFARKAYDPAVLRAGVVLGLPKISQAA